MGAGLASGGADIAGGTEAAGSAQNVIMQDALSALVNLGYSRTEAFTALQTAQKEGQDSDISALIAAALKHLGR